MKRSIYIGFDPRETAAFVVARHSIQKHLSEEIPIHGLVLSDLQRRGLYYRETRRANGRIYDVPSIRPDYEGEMSTEFAISRFLAPGLAGRGWALFQDCDMLAREDYVEVFKDLDPKFALYCVKHNYTPKSETKMDDQKQTAYGRKNWSSFCIFNADHPANSVITRNTDLVNTATGLYLHQFSWLRDDEIGALDPKWNWLAGESDPDMEPAVVHHTNGSPCMSGYADAPFADEWRDVLADFAKWDHVRGVR